MTISKQEVADAFFSDGYEGVTHAGIAIVAADTGWILFAQRAPDPTDAPDVAETWEFPGGGLNPGEDAQAAAFREFGEEVGCPVPPDAEVVNGWRSANGVYQLFIATVPGEFDLSGCGNTDEVQAVAWMTPDQAMSAGIRPEMADFDWDLLDVSGNEDDMTAEMADDTDYSAIFAQPVPIHGVIAPEDVPTGDKRGFLPGSMSTRPYRLPFRWAESDIGGHDGAVAIGSVDRMMRKDGLIHWEGQMMNTPKADQFTALMQFFGGRYGVSVDGDNGSLDMEKSQAEGVAWFDAVRASGLTAVDIPAFSEAYVAFGPHPDMPADESEEYAVLAASGDVVSFKRGAGWVTNPADTKRIHDYWMPGHPGGDKIGWGTPGDFTRAKKLIGEKIAANSPEDMRFLNQIIAQWHHDALGYWPGELGKPGNAPDTPENRKRAARHAAANRGIIASEDDLTWEVVLTSSGADRALPPVDYFTKPDHEFDGLVIEEPDEHGFRRTYGYAGERGVCHIGYDGRCVEIPVDESEQYPEFHLGRTKTADGYINTGVVTYKVDHRDAETILSESAEKQHYDNIAHAWAAVRLGTDENGIWYSGVVLPGIPEDDITLIEATGQVSGEWKWGALRALQCVNVAGFPVMRSSAVINDDGDVVALVASAHGLSTCEPTPAERMAALAQIMAEDEAQDRMAALREAWGL